MPISKVISQFFRTPKVQPNYKEFAEILDRNGLFGLLQPQTELEAELLTKSEIIKGLLWGAPRYGHPEGTVAFHVKEVFENIELLHTSDENKHDLRVIALVHDSFKYLEDRSSPRNWDQHHASIAGRYLASMSLPAHLSGLVSLHDEAFYAWRHSSSEKDLHKSEVRMKKIIDHLPEHLQLYLLFFLCDTLTGDKIYDPIYWLLNEYNERSWGEMSFETPIEP